MSKENTKKNTPAGIIVRMLETKDKGEKKKHGIPQNKNEDWLLIGINQWQAIIERCKDLYRDTKETA